MVSEESSLIWAVWGMFAGELWKMQLARLAVNRLVGTT
jgi:hypothetical protein